MYCTASNEVLQAALRYAAAGYPVFPLHSCIDGRCSCGNAACKSPGKHPRTGNGFKDATTDEETITAWFTRWPESNLGMSTEGLLVVDVDPGAADWAVEHIDDWEPGLWQKTPRNGTHIVFDGGGHGCRCSTGKVAPHVDIRADGGYIVVAPSQINENSYEWDKPLPPRNELPTPPDWLVGRAKGTTRPQAAAPSVNGRWHAGVRNDRLFSTGCGLRNNGLGPEVIESSLQAVNERSCDPPLAPEEVTRIARSVATYSVDNRIGKTMLTGVPISSRFNGNGNGYGSPSDVPATGQIDYAPITAADLASRVLSVDWLVDHLLAAGQPCILAGPKKTLKTSIGLDLAISLASGTPFLGQFQVPLQRRVAFMSGESGLPVLQETLLRICQAKQVDTADLNALVITEQLPRIGDRLHEDAMEAFIDQCKLDLCIIDPAYLSMPGQDAGNLFINGDRLRVLNRLTQRTGCTFVLLHHNRKSTDKSNKHGVPQLEDIAWAGFQEWARQWLLLNRREEYTPGSGDHRLWLAAGGSAGHGGVWGVDIQEGVLGPGTSRFWDADVRTFADVSDDMAGRKGEIRNTSRSQKLEEDVRAALHVLAESPDGLTKHKLREACGMSGDRVNRTLESALEQDLIQLCTVPRANRKTPDNGYKLNVHE